MAAKINVLFVRVKMVKVASIILSIFTTIKGSNTKEHLS